MHLRQICKTCRKEIAYYPIKMFTGHEWITTLWVWVHINPGYSSHAAQPANLIKRLRHALLT